MIGGKTATGGAYYFMEKDGNKVYTIGKYTGEKLDVTKNKIRNKTLFTAESEDINELSLERNGSMVFAAEKTGEFEWTLNTPIQGSANVGAIDLMVNSVSSIVVSDFIEDNATDLGQYGLENPRYVLSFATSSEKEKLMLGKEIENGSKFYARLSDSNDVFTISSAGFNYIDKPLKEIIEVFVYIVNISDVDRIVVEMDGYTDVSTIKTDPEDKDKDKFTFNGKDASMPAPSGKQPFRNYYQSLIGVTLSDIDLDGKPTGEAEIRFTYHLNKEPGKMVVEFVPRDERTYYALRNGEYTGIVVDKKKFDRTDGLRDMRKRLVEAIEEEEARK